MLTREVKVGDVLCCVDTDPRKGYREYWSVTVTKIGRKYIHINGTDKFTKEGKQVSDYGSRDELYHSEEEYLAEKEKRHEWGKLKTEMYYTYSSNPPNHLTTKEIIEIREKIFPPKPEG